MIAVPVLIVVWAGCPGALASVRIVPFRREWAPKFVELNLAWIEHFFRVEEADRAVLVDCESAIVNKGGQIFFGDEKTCLTIQTYFGGAVAIVGDDGEARGEGLREGAWESFPVGEMDDDVA